MSPGLMLAAWVMLVTTLAGATTQPGQAGVPLRPPVSPDLLTGPGLSMTSPTLAGLPSSISLNFLPSHPGNNCRLLTAFLASPGRLVRHWPSSQWVRNQTRLD